MQFQYWILGVSCWSRAALVRSSFKLSIGRAQWIDSEPKIQESIDACPVECIHWVSKEELPTLEYVMQKRMARTNVGVMMSGGGGGRGSGGNVFDAAVSFAKERKQRCAVC